MTAGWNTRLVSTLVDSELNAGFGYLSYNESNIGAGTGALLGKAVDIWQDVNDTVTGTSQSTVYRVRGGYKGLCPPPGGFFCTAREITSGDSVTLDGVTVTWGAGDTVEAFWSGSSMGGTFSHETVTANTGLTGAQIGTASETSNNSTTVFDWPTNEDADMNWPLPAVTVPPPDASVTAPPSL